jgi:hypothetical protein
MRTAADVAPRRHPLLFSSLLLQLDGYFLNSISFNCLIDWGSLNLIASNQSLLMGVWVPNAIILSFSA